MLHRSHPAQRARPAAALQSSRLVHPALNAPRPRLQSRREGNARRSSGDISKRAGAQRIRRAAGSQRDDERWRLPALRCCAVGAASAAEQHYPDFRELRAREGRSLPEHVQEEFDAWLKCGRLEEGFLRVRCGSCHAEKLVSFGCKRRGRVLLAVAGAWSRPQRSCLIWRTRGWPCREKVAHFMS